MAKIKQIYCNTCKGETNHEIKASHNKEYYEVDHLDYVVPGGYYALTEYYFLVCRGCDTATLDEKWASAGMTDDNGGDFYSYCYYPKRKRKDFREREAKHFCHVDEKLIKTYKEIITAF
ncbi:hypothetical protein [Candidatus Nitrosoglobus terrae]|uniref:hypothetical protein n=1 Tax=Candidatus Nitrosoglobus terrae TaxID=1630141 RepID=UPI0011AB2DF8|nr:hypothetical protein [Candidatus Nitrosoglobus terrae]